MTPPQKKGKTKSYARFSLTFVCEQRERGRRGCYQYYWLLLTWPWSTLSNNCGHSPPKAVVYSGKIYNLINPAAPWSILLYQTAWYQQSSSGLHSCAFFRARLSFRCFVLSVRRQKGNTAAVLSIVVIIPGAYRYVLLLSFVLPAPSFSAHHFSSKLTIEPDCFFLALWSFINGPSHLEIEMDKLDWAKSLLFCWLSVSLIFAC